MPASEKRFGCLGVFIVVLLCLSLLFNLLFLIGGFVGAIGAGSQNFRETVLTEGTPNLKSKIAVIRLGGIISSGDMGFGIGASPDEMKQNT